MNKAWNLKDDNVNINVPGLLQLKRLSIKKIRKCLQASFRIYSFVTEIYMLRCVTCERKQRTERESLFCSIIQQLHITNYVPCKIKTENNSVKKIHALQMDTLRCWVLVTLPIFDILWDSQ